MRYFKKIPGQRIYLSPINVDDCELYVKWMNDPSVTNNLGNSALLLSVTKEREMLENLAKNGHNFAIVREDNDQLIGNTSLINVDLVRRTAVCGIFIGDDINRGKGYGSETLKLLLGYGFGTLNLNNIMLCVFSFNERAIACYESVGFKRIGSRRKAYCLNGTWYDEIFMDILQEEFGL